MEKRESSIYTDGSYLAKSGGTWHAEDSPFKARQIVRMLNRHPEFEPHTICEIGCGAGGILAELQKDLPDDVSLLGYEISPHAHALSTHLENDRCHFILGDSFASDRTFDLVLVLDVIEHVEDCFSFLRATRQKGKLKMYHVPLDVYATAAIRGLNSWDVVGHLHMFTIETALKSVEHSGHRIVDWMLTDHALEKRAKTLRTRISNLARAPLARISPVLAARVMGGFSILILAE